MSKNIPLNASERVSVALKSKLEKQLISETDAVVLSGHNSTIVSTDLNPTERDELNSNVSWDDKRFDEFMNRLGVIDSNYAA